MTLLIMAAGMGSRYGGIKQIEPIGAHNELIIDYSIYDAVLAGFTKVVFVIRRDIEKDFCETIFNRIKSQAGIKAEYVFQDLTDLPDGFQLPPERVKPWGTTHAILAARKVINTPFCIVNADDFYGREAFAKMAKFLGNLGEESTHTSLVGYKLCNTISDAGSVSRGIAVVEGNSVTTIDERIKVEKRGDEYGYTLDETFYPELQADSNASMNVFGFGPAIMPMLKERFAEFLTQRIDDIKAELQISIALNDLLHQGKITMEMMTTNDKWLGFTYPEDKIKVQNEIKVMVESGIYPSPLWKK